MNIINVVSNDAGKMERSVLALGMLAFAPFDIVLSLYIVWKLIGWEAIFGVGVFVLVVLYISLMARIMSHLQSLTVGYGDRRLAAISDVITGIRALKMNTWESYFTEKIRTLRGKEVRCILRKGAILSTFGSSNYTTTSIAALVSFIVMIYGGAHLNAPQIFTLLVAFNVLKIAICTSLTDSLQFLVDARIAVERVQTFLEDDKIYPSPQNRERSTKVFKKISQLIFSRAETPKTAENPDGLARKPRGGSLLSNAPALQRNTRITMTEVSASWTNDVSQTALDKVTMDVSGSQLVVITGPVGGGKSSLLSSILEELPLCNGDLRSIGTIAYMSQTPWVFSGTIRENAVFGREFKQELYWKILESCDLQQDLAAFPGGDETIVGQHGASLSGGQRARVSLARALYSQANIYLLDDPLSAVDSKVAKRLFDRCICGMLSERLRVLVTHQVQYAKAADHVIVLDQGSVTHQGNPEQIQDGAAMSKISVGGIDNEQQSSCDAKEPNRQMSVKMTEPRQDTVTQGLAEAAEDSRTGPVTLQLYWIYMKAALHPCGLVVLMLFFCFFQGKRNTLLTGVMHTTNSNGVTVLSQLVM